QFIHNLFIINKFANMWLISATNFRGIISTMKRIQYKRPDQGSDFCNFNAWACQGGRRGYQWMVA
ncbi:MAG TPA: hypothetical protein VL126_10625, partial [Bacteroidota bacterium]|nr:hypothetical protein [Bacteroidota bacterium]